MSNHNKYRNKSTKNYELNLEESVPYLIYRITNALTSNIRDDLSPTNISIQEWRVLTSLKSRNGKSTISELSACTIIKQPIISRIITEMQENGFVQKATRKNDRRITDIMLTNKGNKLLESLMPILIRHREKALAHIDKNEIDKLRKMLKQIQYNLGIKPISNSNNSTY